MDFDAQPAAFSPRLETALCAFENMYSRCRRFGRHLTWHSL